MELGKLTAKTRRDGTPGNPHGQNTVYAGYSWRIESLQSILGGNADSQQQRIAKVEKLLGTTVKSATLTGHIPELVLAFSNGYCLATFEITKGQTNWSVSFRAGRVVRLVVKRGKLAVDPRDF